jgi:hypothetical protein
MTDIVLYPHPGWIAGERLWLHQVLADVELGWGGLLETLSFLALVAVSLLAWFGVLAVLIDSVVR